jgi:hypothetical protein
MPREKHSGEIPRALSEDIDDAWEWKLAVAETRDLKGIEDRGAVRVQDLVIADAI